MADDLGRYSKVYRRVWRDEKFRSLSDRGKLCFLRMVTAPEMGSVPGVVIGTDAHFARTLGWSLEAFREAFGEAFAKGMARVDWEAGLVWLPRAMRYNRPESPNVVRSWRREWPEIPECQLKREAFIELKAFAKGFGKAFAEAFTEALPEALPEPVAVAVAVAVTGAVEGRIATPAPAGAGPQQDSTPAAAGPPEPDAFCLKSEHRVTSGSKKGDGKQLRHIGPGTPVEGLDEMDRCRRRFAIEWKASERYNGTPYPDQPGPDRKAMADVLAYHRRNKLEEPWQPWVLRVFRSYLEIADDRYIVSACHPLALIPRNLPRIVTAMKDG